MDNSRRVHKRLEANEENKIQDKKVENIDIVETKDGGLQQAY